MKRIKLTQGKYALVDDEDFDYVNQWKWYYDAGYARRTIKNRGIFMHIVILSKPLGMEVDHKDGNGINNQRNNLRLCIRVQNVQNRSKSKNKSSKYKGVGLLHGKWQATITYQYKKYYLGWFKTEKEAAIMYNREASKMFGEFAKLNIIT